MTKFNRNLLAASLLAAIGTGSAQAALVLNYHALTAANGTLANGDSIAPGALFDLHATFEPTPITTGTGVATYALTAMNYAIDGVSYALPGTSLGDFAILLSDPTSIYSPDYYMPAIVEGSGAIPALFTGTSTTGFDVTNPVATVFTGYQSSTGMMGGLSFTVASGGANTVYIDGASFDASITEASVPEPSSLALLFGGAAAVGATRRRRAPA